MCRAKCRACPERKHFRHRLHHEHPATQPPTLSPSTH
ncbi:hypothetical protein E2C01_078100 [Portunus trituberculatus]|uniref:Uncharacterized protein n=1 Tax=Portunus trituberculatus TaxID=210409 RepID=A0A5B7ID43_PORTR|nr:hypothetical protein [Portunus trituberculatus]